MLRQNNMHLLTKAIRYCEQVEFQNNCKNRIKIVYIEAMQNNTTMNYI